ncbi:3-ketoacyl-ACP reductase [Qingrenia yutianensis]|uniref:3-ketoacyl-ACP reductase n=1 Tax=Qingrenia yutianensis TaxID=2763676 RepID=A0A926FCV6_9FIRM|nr:3-ketoacyl-ACP reductase [Qingrenia yutianensis]MBC8596912.1 3-ketoacyl-ACP reductase [Qingrenia yutianensis]
MKSAIITGCCGGIGGAAAEKFLSEGYFVVGMDICDKTNICNEIFSYVKGDLSKKADRENLINTAIQKCGRIDVLVNVAGVAPRVRADLLEMSEESYDFVMNINTKGTLFLTQLTANAMLKQELKDGVRGYIVNISSMSAYTSSVNRGEYCISKAGVSMITRLFADRLANDGIIVNEVRPGIISTSMTDKVKDKYDALIDGGLLPQKRWGMPEDIAKAVYTLCSGDLPYVIGQSIDVDGGFHIARL